MLISLIAAISKNNVIGNKGKIPWHIAEDFKHFKELTLGHPVIMGQKTFESIGRPLPGRTNILLTNDISFKAEGCIIVSSPEEAIKEAGKTESDEIFVIGGGIVYKTFLPLSEKVYLTKIDKEYEGDTYFPELNDSEWEEKSKEVHYSEGEKVKFSFLILQRRK